MNIIENINVLFEQLETNILQRSEIEDIHKDITALKWSIITLVHMKDTDNEYNSNRESREYNNLSQIYPINIDLTQLNTLLQN